MDPAAIRRWAICGGAVLALHGVLLLHWPLAPATPPLRRLLLELGPAARSGAPRLLRGVREPAPGAPLAALAQGSVRGSAPPVPKATAAAHPAAAPRPRSATAERARLPARMTAPAGAAQARVPALPVYPVALLPSGRWHYRVLHNGRSGDALLRWEHDGDRYEAALQAREADAPDLALRSAGRLDGAGLAPERFVDQRARRGAQAANFERDAHAISYSGSDAQRPLPAGAQDRLSLWLQLAGIVAAQPGRWAPGSVITTYASGARGDADVWTWRVQGLAPVDDAGRDAGLALKLHRDPLRQYDTEADAWLDPARGYLPARLRWRNGPYVFELRLVP